MELPDNRRNEFMMDFKKFAQSVKGLIYSEDKVFIKGVFRGKMTKEIVSCDDFMANKVWKSGESLNAELVYRTYLEWFNRTLLPHEEEREFISAKFGSELKS